MEKLDIVVRVCNSESIIDRLLRHLMQLRLPFEWEAEQVKLIFIDNYSQDNTVEKITSMLHELPMKARLVVEKRKGAAATRARGILEAQGDYVAFLDDDNLPASDWILQVKDAILAFPNASALSGRINAVTAEPIPSYAEPYKVFYAIVNRGDKAFRYDVFRRVLPPGAGLILRRTDALEVVQYNKLRIDGPVEKGFHFKGEDIEFLRKMQARGCEIWYTPNVCIDHALSMHRFALDYLVDFLKAIARPRHYHRMLLYPVWLWPIMTVLYFSIDLQRLLFHIFRYNDSIDWRLRYTFLSYILISPIYTKSFFSVSRSHAENARSSFANREEQHRFI